MNGICIYIPGTQIGPPVLIPKTPCFGGLFRPKIEDKQVPGIYTYILSKQQKPLLSGGGNRPKKETQSEPNKRVFSGAKL